jgi:hypothetical protein
MSKLELTNLWGAIWLLAADLMPRWYIIVMAGGYWALSMLVVLLELWGRRVIKKQDP